MNNSQESILRKRPRQITDEARLSGQSQEAPAKLESEFRPSGQNSGDVSQRSEKAAATGELGKTMRRHGKLRETGKKTDNENLQKPELASFNNANETTTGQRPQRRGANQPAAELGMPEARNTRVRTRTQKVDESGQLYMSSKELRQFQMAMRNSITETENVNNGITDIEQMKTYFPTEQQFSDPLIYIDSLIKNENIHQYGCIKIVPPSSFKPPVAFDRQSDQKLPTRFQVLQELAQGKAFKQNATGRTFREFMALSRQHEEHDRPVSQDEFAQLEKRYWDMVENQVGPRTRVEYAADVPTGRFGSGFPKRSNTGAKPSAEQAPFVDHPWNLNNLPRAVNSLMQFPRRHDISGINIPWLYIGMRYSTFCWHYEDLMLFSINYSHWGAPKQWYCVPEADREKLEKAVKQKAAILFKKDPNILLDIVTMVSPAYLQQHKIKVYKTLQRPGEFVLTLPGSYHAGFSTGLNIGEAVNFASHSWLKYGPKCQELYRRTREKIPVFPIEWVVTENIRNLERLLLDAETRLALLQKFSEYANFEINQRTFMEQEMQTRLSVKDPSELPQGYQVSIIMPNRDQVSEDAHQCHFCTDFAYFSQIRCTKCDICYCIWHNVHCGCSVPSVQLVYRFSLKEIRDFKAKIAAAVQQDRQKAQARRAIEAMNAAAAF